MTTHQHICPLCEATCGLVVTVEDGAVVDVRGDAEDVFSGGFICPKGAAIGQLHHDPDRLRTPLVRDEASGALVPATWERAFEVIRARLRAIIEAHGADATAVYLGNPNVHNVASAFYLPAFLRGLGTVNRFSASTVDQMPKQVASALMYGTPLSVAIADIDRTDYFLVLGANPLVSNGSMMTAPDMPGRLKALKSRGGRLVVVDPVRTRTAKQADEYLAIRPGSDALWLAALAHVLYDDGLVDAGRAGAWITADDHVAIAAATLAFTPEAVASVTGIPAPTTRRIAHELAAAPRAAVYGRMGTTTGGLALGDGTVSQLGTIASWLIDVVNIAIGSLDEPGGVLWPLPPAGGPSTEGTSGSGRGATIPGRRSTRVRGLPSIFGEFPAATLAEEIDTPDAADRRIRALFTIAGNPVLSTPDGDRLDRALGTLDLLVSVDAYLTETSRHAHVVLPVPSPLARRHFDVVFNALAIRDTARYSRPSVPIEPSLRDEADILAQLAAIAISITSGVPEPTIEAVDGLVAHAFAQQAATDEASRAHGREPSDLLAGVAPQVGVERLLDLRIRSGPHGDGFGLHPDGLTLARIEAAPHGIDLGPLRPRLPEVLRTPTGRIELAPAQLVEALLAARPLLEEGAARPGLVLVGRRQLRSNNSWMHNLPALAGGSNRCTLLMHPLDALRLGLSDGASVRVATAAGAVVVPLSVTEDVSLGVVSMPHGWGHVTQDAWGETARQSPGANVNHLIASTAIDMLSGTAALSGIPVEVDPA
jgi:anaerobic selenocysteine-containing dehydrogenase